MIVAGKPQYKSQDKKEQPEKMNHQCPLKIQHLSQFSQERDLEIGDGGLLAHAFGQNSCKGVGSEGLGRRQR